MKQEKIKFVPWRIPVFTGLIMLAGACGGSYLEDSTSAREQVMIENAPGQYITVLREDAQKPKRYIARSQEKQEINQAYNGK